MLNGIKTGLLDKPPDSSSIVFDLEQTQQIQKILLLDPGPGNHELIDNAYNIPEDRVQSSNSGKFNYCLISL